MSIILPGSFIFLFRSILLATICEEAPIMSVMKSNANSKITCWAIRKQKNILINCNVIFKKRETLAIVSQKYKLQ